MRARFEPAQNLSFGFVELRYAVVIPTTPRHEKAQMHSNGLETQHSGNTIISILAALELWM